MQGPLVAVTFHEGQLGGATRSLLRAVPHLQERGWRFAFYVDHPSDLSEHLAEEGYDVGGRRRHVGFSTIWLKAPPGPREKLKAYGPWLTGFTGFMRERRPALLHANSLYTLPEALIARGLRTPALLHVHEMLPGNWKGSAAARMIRRAGIVPVGVSTACAERLAAGGPVPAIAYESSPVPETAVSRPDNPSPTVVGSVGVIAKRKGTDVLIEAARRVLAQRDDVEFHLLAPLDETSPELSWAQEQVQAARAAGIVHHPGGKTFEHLPGWDLFTIASRFDPFPLVVLEAMASGLPVVGTRVDGIAEQVTPETGLLAAVDDPDELAARIIELVDDPARRRAMGAAGRERVTQNFTPEKQAESIDAVYRAMLGR